MTTGQARKVQRNRIVFWSAVAATVGLLAILSVFLSRPDAAATATGVAIESARDVNGTAKAPVSYSFDGVTRVEMVRTESTAGGTVTFPVSHEGQPASDSWGPALLMGVMVALLLGATSLLGFLFSQEDYETRLFEARELDERHTFQGV